MLKRLIVGLLLMCSMFLFMMPDIGIAHAASARRCYTYQWKHHHYACTSWHKDPPPLQAFPRKVHERAGLPGEVNFTGTGLEPRTFYEFLSDLPWSCDFVEVHGWEADFLTGLPSLEDRVIFNRYPILYGAPAVLVPPEVHIFTDVGGNASFTVIFDGCVKRLDPPYYVHLVSLSGNGTEFTGSVKISVS